jgi:peptidoglycan/xylan/chitin deacetylase (PgdA/CDA1 family)
MRGLAWSIVIVVSFAALQGSAAKFGRPAAADTTVCTVSGTGAADQLVGTSAAEVICGGGGDDVIYGGGGDDVILGGAGDDRVYGGGGSDRMLGGSGSDVMDGGVGTDLIRGGDGGDHVIGRRGGDELRGESGGDSVVGGRGLDRLFGGDGHDTLRSRDRAPYDRLDGGIDRNLCVADAGDHRVRCRRPLDARHRRGVPILMYHVIQAPTASTPLPGLYVVPSVFAAQMRWLAHHHFHAVTLQEAYDYWHGGPLPSRPVVISFDDGFRNQYTKALPILAHHHWPGTLNLALSHFAQPGWGLGPRMIKAMIRNGWEIDSHTMTHVSLPGLLPDQLSYQVAHSRVVLQKRFDVPVNFFCYPAGAFNSTVIAAVRHAGYQGATSTQPGFARWDEPWTLNRIRMTNSTRPRDLATLLHA